MIIPNRGAMYIKSIILVFLASLAAIAFWFFYKEIVSLGTFQATATYFVILFVTMYMVTMGLLMLFAKRAIEYGIAVAAGVAPLCYFFGFSLLSVSIVFIYGALAFYALGRVRDELKSRINFNTIILLRQGIPLLLTALSLAFAVAYFIETSRAPERITIRDIIPPSLVNAVISRADPIKFTAALSVDEYIERQLQTAGADISSLSQVERERFFEEARQQLAESFLKNAPPLRLKGSEKVGDVVYELILSRSDQLFASYRTIIPVTFAIGFFLFLRTVAFPYGWLILWVSAGIVKALHRTGILTPIEEQTKKEWLRWA